MITFERVTKRYPDGTIAVDTLDLEVPAGRTMVLVGPSGCGKTTSLRMINRLIEPTGGRVLLDGHDVRAQDPSRLRRGIGYVIQQAGLFPHRTVQDNIATVPVLNGWPRSKARGRARELLALVGLDPALATRYPHQLSGGQQQRVGVARALAADPPVLLMDEPFSAVDPIVRTALQDQLLALQAELHKTIVLVTHDIEEAIRLGDEVALFRPHGTLAQAGPPEQLLATPADSYVADFVGFDRGIRRLSFFATDGLALDRGPVLDVTATAADALSLAHAARTTPVTGASPADWVLVTAGGRPRGWVAAGTLVGLDPTTVLSQVPTVPFGHPFTVGSDTLRAALDAAVLSPAGQAIGVDADGRVLGVATFDQIRAAIAAGKEMDGQEMDGLRREGPRGAASASERAQARFMRARGAPEAQREGPRAAELEDTAVGGAGGGPGGLVSAHQEEGQS